MLCRTGCFNAKSINRSFDSFHANRLEQGLESLRKLTDLFLYHNRIHDAEGTRAYSMMITLSFVTRFLTHQRNPPVVSAGLAQAGCRGLQYLSLGHNRLDLSRPSSLLSLLAKRFPALEALVLHKQEQQLPPPEQEEQQQEEKEVGEEEEVKAAVVKALPQLQYLDHALVKQPIVLGDDAEKKGARLGVVGA